MAVLVCMFTVFVTITTATTIFADNPYNVELLDLKHISSPTQETITVNVQATIPVDDFVTAKLINLDGQTVHKMWYKVNSNSLTTFTLTFTDIDKLSIRGIYTIQIQYDDMVDEKTVTLN